MPADIPVDESGEPNLRLLLDVPSVTAEIGQRLYCQRAPDNVRGTYAVWKRAGGTRESTLCGRNSLVEGSYQIDIYARDAVPMVNAARAIRRAMLDDIDVRGSAGIRRVLLENDFDSVDPDPGLNRRTQIYSVWYVED